MLILTIGAVPQLGTIVEGYPIPGDVNRILTYIGLFIMALGNGGIKPCVSSLGGDQFTGQEWVHFQLKFQWTCGLYTVTEDHPRKRTKSQVEELQASFQCFMPQSMLVRCCQLLFHPFSEKM